MYPLLISLAVAVIAAVAEWLHTRRIRVVARLAFGPEGQPRAWTRSVPLLRVASLAAFAWGLSTLFFLAQAAADGSGAKANRDATRVVFVIDLSPSMYLQDSAADGKLSRRERMRDVVDGILQRISGNLRFGVVAFYTESLPVIMEARDPDLVRNVLNGLPLSYAMPVGKTDLATSVNDALAQVEQFPKESTRIVILTDGDTIPMVPLSPRPASVKEVLVLGLGNPTKGTYIDGHQSRQEGDTLQLLASALHGSYEDVNEKHVSTNALGDLVVTAPMKARWWSLQNLAVMAMALGAAIYAFIPLALERLGSDWEVAPIASRKRSTDDQSAWEAAPTTR